MPKKSNEEDTTSKKIGDGLKTIFQNSISLKYNRRKEVDESLFSKSKIGKVELKKSKISKHLYPYLFKENLNSINVFAYCIPSTTEHFASLLSHYVNNVLKKGPLNWKSSDTVTDEDFTSDFFIFFLNMNDINGFKKLNEDIESCSVIHRRLSSCSMVIALSTSENCKNILKYSDVAEHCKKWLIEYFIYDSKNMEQSLKTVNMISNWMVRSNNGDFEF